MDPCNVLFWRILPAVRRELARILVEERGFSRRAAAKVLGVTPAALSQYLSGKRGGPVPEWVRDYLRGRVDAGDLDVCRIVLELREHPCFCELLEGDRVACAKI